MASLIFENDMIASSRGAEWHGLAKTPDQELQTIADIVGFIPEVFRPVIESPLTLQGTNVVIPGFKATYLDLGAAGKRPIGVVGDNYTVLQNKEAISVFSAALEAGLIKFETAGTLCNFSRFFACFSFCKGGRAAILPGDPTFRVVIVMNSHDGNSSLKVFIANIRVVCGNTWRAALESQLAKSIGVLNQRHTVNIHQSLEMFESAINYDEAIWQKEEIAALKSMTGVHLSEGMAEMYIKQTMSVRKRLTQAMIDDESKRLPEETEETDKVRRSFMLDTIKELHETSATSATKGYRGSVYGWYQTVLEFLQYESGHDTKGFDTRLYDQLQGENVDRCKLAYDNALALVR